MMTTGHLCMMQMSFIIYRHTAQRNRIVCTYETPIEQNEGFFSGMDLIPNS